MKRFSGLLLNDSVILWLVAVNSVLIFAQGFGLRQPYQFILMISDDLITLIFITELAVKISHYGMRNYLKSWWNVFDAAVILLAAPSVFSLLFTAGESHLDYFLVLRVFRVFKFFRIIRFFPNIDRLMTAVSRALKASVIVIIGFVIYNFVISVVSCFLYREIAPEYFGDPLIAFYSVFKVFTVEGWYEIPDLIASRTGETMAFLTKCYFAVILVTGGIFGLSLVNSIFVDAMVSDNNDELERKVDLLSEKIDRLLDNK